MTNFDYTDFLYDRSTLDLFYDEVDFYGSFYMALVSVVSSAVASISLYIDETIHQRPTNEAVSVAARKHAQALAGQGGGGQDGGEVDDVPEGWYNVNRMFLQSYDNSYQDGTQNDEFTNGIPNTGYQEGIPRWNPQMQFPDGIPNGMYQEGRENLRYVDGMPDFGNPYASPEGHGYSGRFSSGSPPPGYESFPVEFGWDGSYSQTSPPPYATSGLSGTPGDQYQAPGDVTQSSYEWSERGGWNGNGNEAGVFQWNGSSQDAHFQSNEGRGQGGVVWDGRQWNPLYPPGSLGEEDILEEVEEEEEEELINFGNELYYGTGGGEYRESGTNQSVNQ